MTSFGNGMRLGRVNEPRPVLVSVQKTNANALVTVSAAPGQRVVLSGSPDLGVWTPVVTNVMFGGQFTATNNSAAAMKFFRAEVR